MRNGNNWKISGDQSLNYDFTHEPTDSEFVFEIKENSNFELKILYNLEANAPAIKHKILIQHYEAGSTSKVLIHSVLRDHTSLDLTGRIEVKGMVPGTDAGLLHKTLMLSNDATVNTKPELIIEHDDVKCGHGATISGIDPKHLNYLQSRGIATAEAEDIIVQAFINKVKC